MKKSSAKHHAPGRRYAFLLIAMVTVVVATAITVISRQQGIVKRTENRVETKPSAASAKTYVTRRVGGQDIHIDSQSGDIKPLTPEEARKIANGLAPMLDDSADGLRQVKHADGSVSIDLEGRFQNVTVARINADGTMEQACVDNPRAAAKFFRIDPKLIENAPTARKRVRN